MISRIDRQSHLFLQTVVNHRGDQGPVLAELGFRFYQRGYGNNFARRQVHGSRAFESTPVSILCESASP